MSTVSRGNAAENYVAEWLEERGWVVASRRHRKGGGDHLANYPADLPPPGVFGSTCLLIETKGCKPEALWQNFRRAQREEMRNTPLPPGGERWLALVKGSKRGDKDNRTITWYAEEEWP